MRLFRKTVHVQTFLDEVVKQIDLGFQKQDNVLRQLVARVARSEAKNFFALHVGTELEKFERELQQRSERALANLGSAAPTLEQHAAEAMSMLKTCNGCTAPNLTVDFQPNPDCPAHGDPAVLALLKDATP